MNIIKKLNDEKNAILTLKKYSNSDLSTPHTIKIFFENFMYIQAHYSTKLDFKFNTIEEYIDYLFLNYLAEYEELSDNIIDEYKEEFHAIMNWTKSILLKYKNSDLIDFISSNYSSIFSFQDDLYYQQVYQSTLDLVVKYNKGLFDSGIFNYLIEHKYTLIFDRFEDIYKILIKNDSNLLNLIFNENKLSSIADFRLDKVCGYLVMLHRLKNEDLVNKITDFLVKHVTKITEENSEVHIYQVQSEVDLILHVFEKIKYERIRDISKLKIKVDSKVDEEIVQNGNSHQYELTSKIYSDLMDDLDSKGTSSLLKYLLITHKISNKSKLWISVVEDVSKEYKPSLVDFCSTNIKTNTFFTLGKINTIDMAILQCVMSLFYWLKTSEKQNELVDLLQLVIETIYNELDILYNEFDLKEDIKNFVKGLERVAEKGTDNLEIHLYSFYFISFLEKILRNIFCQLREDGYFKETKTTLTEIIGNNNYVEEQIEKLIGDIDIRWLRYYLLEDEDHVGVGYRNRIAHFRDIKIGDIHCLESLKIGWLVLSTINSVFNNIINRE